MSRVKQKISGCFRTRKYAEACCRISSYLQSMANQGYNPLVAIQIALAGRAVDSLPDWLRRGQPCGSEDAQVSVGTGRIERVEAQARFDGFDGHDRKATTRIMVQGIGVGPECEPTQDGRHSCATNEHTMTRRTGCAARDT